MTQKLEDLFDLPSAEELEEMGMIEALDQEPTEAPTEKRLVELDETIDKIDAALPTIKDIATSDAELDELAKMASDEFKNLMRLGMNVEPRFGAEIFNTASSMLGHAITAKTQKVNNKLRVVSLQIAKRRVDIAERKMIPEELEEGEATELTTAKRNELLQEILDQNKADKAAESDK